MKQQLHDNFLFRCALLLSFLGLSIFGFTSCIKKNKKYRATISGSLKIPDDLKRDIGNATVIVGISEAPFHELIDDPMVHIKQFVATNDLENYQIVLDSKKFGSGPRELQIFAFVDRDFSSKKAPKVSKGDLIGFYVQDLKPGLAVDLGKNDRIQADIEVSRVSAGRRLEVEFENSEAFVGTFQVGLYCGEIDGLSLNKLAMSNVVYVRPLEKKTNYVRQKFSFELFLGQPTEWCYPFSFFDENNNQKADPDENFGFFTDRSDELPSQVNITQASIGPLNIKHRFKIPKQKNQPIIVKGTINISPEIKAESKRIFVIVAKQSGPGIKFDQATKQVLGFAKVGLDGGEFEVDLTQSPAEVGDVITVFSLGDQEIRGLPMLTEGDGLGLPLEDQRIIEKKLVAGVNGGFTINLNRKYYEGKATVNVSLDNPYKGKVLVVAYGGEISLDTKAIDPDKVFGLNLFDKVDQKATVQVDTYSIGQKWPLEVYMIGVLDANGNMKADPGEMVQLPLDQEGKPRKIKLGKGDQVNFDLTYLYTLQIPSFFNMTVRGKFHLSTSELPKYIYVLVAQSDDIEKVIVDPLKYVKSYQKVPGSAKQYTVSLTNTALKPGDRVQILALTSTDDQIIPKLDEKSLVGIYMQNGKLGLTLKDGDNAGIDLVVDKTSYRDKISVLGILDNDYRGKVIASLYAGNPLDLINQTYDYNDFISVVTGNKETDRFEVSMSDLVTNRKLPVRGMAFIVEDANGNETADPGEVLHFAYQESKDEPLFLDIRLGDIYSFVFNHRTIIPTPSLVPVTLKGRVNVNSSVAGSKIYVMVLDNALESFSPSEISQKLYSVKEVSLNQPYFNFDLAKVGKKPGDKVVIAALVDRDYRDFPRLTPNDLVGFYTGSNAWSYELKEGEQGEIVIDVDRPLYDGEAVLEGELAIDSSKGRNLFAVAYGGPIDNLSDIEVNPRDILGFLKVGTTNRFELKVTPIGYEFPASVYLFLIDDLNGNQALDPGEPLYYFSSRPDRIPQKTAVNRGQRIRVSLNQVLTLPQPKGYPIQLSGKLTWSDTDASKPAYLFVARSQNLEELSRDPLKAMRYLQKLEGRPSTYGIDLTNTDLAPGDSIIVGAWVDQDESQGPSVGDRIGIFQRGLEGYVFPLREQGQTDGDIAVEFTLYDTVKTIDVAFLNSNYSGRVLALVYKGSLDGMSVNSLNPKDVVGLADFEKSIGQASFKINVLPTQKLPLEAVMVFALLDSNRNGKPDPGEEVYFSSARVNSFPKSFALTNDFADTVSLNSPLRIQQPAQQNLVLEGVIDSNMTNSASYPTVVAVFQETDLANLTREPLKYLKEYRVLPSGTSNFNISLATTDLMPGQKIMALALQNPVSDPLSQTQIVEGAFAGILLNGSSFATSWTLVEGVNNINSNGYSLVIKRKYYDHMGRISEIALSGQLSFSEGDNLMLAAYKQEANPANLASLTNIDYDKVVAYGQKTFQIASKYQINIFQALVPGVVDEGNRQIQGVLLVGWKDLNGNARLEDDEPIGFYCDSGNPVFPTTLNLQLSNNQFPGSIKFKGPGQTPGSIRAAFGRGIQDILDLGICQP